MRNVGFAGGATLFELGPTSDVTQFFECLKLVVQKHPKQNWSILTDRLYRRYLRLDELETALALMEEAEKVFAGSPSSAFIWSDAISATRLNTKHKTLADIFHRYFEGFRRCVGSAQYAYDHNRDDPDYKYEPVLTLIMDQPWLMLESVRPRQEYEDLQGLPFWLQWRDPAGFDSSKGHVS